MAIGETVRNVKSALGDNTASDTRAPLTRSEFVLLVSVVLLGFTHAAKYHIDIAAIALICTYFLITRKLRWSKIVIYTAISATLISFPYVQNTAWLPFAGKSLHFFNIFTLLYLSRHFSTPKTSLIFFSKLFTIVSFFSVLSALVFGGNFDTGAFDFVRISGPFTDPNYFAFVCAVLLINLHSIRHCNCAFTKFLLLILIIFSQSVTVLCLIFLFYLHIIRFLTIFKYLILFLPAIMAIFIYFDLYQISIRQDWQTNFFSMKANSLFFRLSSIENGLDLIASDWRSIIWGFGSGNSNELIGRVMHNSVLQTFFDHGILGVSIIYLYFLSILRDPDNTTFFVFTILFSLVFDPLWSYLFSLGPLIKVSQKHTNMVV